MYIADGKTNGPAFSWPDGKRIAVMVTFDYDAEFLRISRAKSKGTAIGFTDFSRGQYGPHEGLARCLDMLDTMNIKSTFFVPGAVIETYRDTVEEIHRRGHELACHGYRHESDPELSRDEMIKILDKSEALLAEITGKKPVGHRAPESVLQDFMPELLAERGYQTISPWMTLPITISPSAILQSAVCTRTVRSSATGSRNLTVWPWRATRSSS